MNWDQISANWVRVGPLAQERWPELKDEELGLIDGRRSDLDETLATIYGITTQEARLQTQEWALKLEGQEGDVEPAVEPPMTERAREFLGYGTVDG